MELSADLGGSAVVGVAMELAGTIVPLVTPFTSEEAFDSDAMAALIDFILAEGADALMPTALTGEGTLLAPAEVLSIWKAVSAQVAGQVTLVPAVISTTTRVAVRLAVAAEDMGAAAILVAPILPELYAARAQDEVLGFYEDVARATSLPIILFNYPSLTGVDLVPSLVSRLVAVDSIQGIKESTGDARRVHELQRRFGARLSVICGAPNTALESLALGCQAWITGILNAVPRSGQQLMRAVALADLSLARRVYYTQILPLVDFMARNHNPTGTIKAAIRVRGVDVGVPRRPGVEVSAEDWQQLRDLMANIVRREDRIGAELATR